MSRQLVSASLALLVSAHSGCCFGGQGATPLPTPGVSSPALPGAPWPPPDGRATCDARGTLGMCFEMAPSDYSSADDARSSCSLQEGVFTGSTPCDTSGSVGLCVEAASGRASVFFPPQFTAESGRSLCQSTGGSWL